MARRQANRLTHREVQTIKEAGRHADGLGLYLQVDPSDVQEGKPDKVGAKRWVFVFQWQGKRKEMGLGSVEFIDVKVARDLRDAARKLVSEGKNPIEERRREREATPPPAVPLFGVFAKEIVAGLPLKNAKHRDQWEKTLTTYQPNLQALPVDQITTQDVLTALRPHWKRIHETAERIRGRTERVLDAARAAGHISGPWENPARWKGHLALLLPRPDVQVRHHPALPYAEMADFMAKIRARPSVSARALEFAILTAARTSEVRFATWGEVEGDVWTVPAERMKAGRTHRVPLTQAVLDILDGLRPPPEVEIKGPGYIFPGWKAGEPLSNMSMDKILRLEKSEATVHGMRSTFRDWAGDCTNFADGTIEAALAHQVGDETERAYRRGDALLKRRKLMEAWAGFCAGRTGKVIPMSGSRRDAS